METGFKRIRKRLGLTLEEAAELTGVSNGQLSRIERGESGFTSDSLRAIANGYRCRPSELLEHSPAPPVRLVGYVGAGHEVVPFDDVPEGEGHELVERPPGETREVVAVRVVGDSMWPAYADGDVLYYADPNGLCESAVLHKACACRTAEGRTLIKLVERGSEKGLWTLASYNGPPIRDVALEWASPILWVRKA